MATKKRKSKTRRSKKSLSSGATKRRRRSPARSKGFLSDATNPTMLMNGAKFTFSAGAGGLAGIYISKMLNPSASKLHKGLAILAVGIGGNLLGFNNMSAGAVGAMTAQMFPNGLNDDGDSNFADDSVLSDQPLFLDEDGNAMVLEEGENGAGYRYLSEEEVALYEQAGAFDHYEVVS